MKRRNFIKSLLGAVVATKTVDFTKLPVNAKELGKKNKDFNENIFIGYQAGHHICAGHHNITIDHAALVANTTGTSLSRRTEPL